MLLPADLLSIEKWRAFKGEFTPGSDIPHRIVIVYRRGNELRYFYITSFDTDDRIKKIRLNNRNDPKSVAEIKPSDWPQELKNNSCIQCNKAHIHCETADGLKELYAAAQLQPLGEVPEAVLREVIEAVCASESFTDAEKRNLT